MLVGNKKHFRWQNSAGPSTRPLASPALLKRRFAWGDCLTSELADPWVHLRDFSQLGLEALTLHTSAPSWSARLRSLFWETIEHLQHSKPSVPGTFCSESRQWKPHFKYVGLSRYIGQTVHLLALNKCSAMGPLWGNVLEKEISMS